MLWIWLNQHEHEESNQFRFGEKNYIPARDLKSPVFEFELRHDSFGIAYQLHGDHLCKVWERFLLIWSSFGRFPLYLSRRPSLPSCGSGCSPSRLWRLRWWLLCSSLKSQFWVADYSCYFLFELLWCIARTKLWIEQPTDSPTLPQIIIEIIIVLTECVFWQL